MKKYALGLMAAIISAGFAHAGEMQIEKDDFDGTVFKYYQSTEKEAEKNGLAYILYGYDKKANTVELMAKPVEDEDIVNCDDNPIRIKTQDGTIHDISAESEDSNECSASINPDWIKDEFTLRLPISGSTADTTGKFSTKTLKLDEIALSEEEIKEQTKKLEEKAKEEAKPAEEAKKEDVKKEDVKAEVKAEEAKKEEPKSETKTEEVKKEEPKAEVKEEPKKEETKTEVKTETKTEEVKK